LALAGGGPAEIPVDSPVLGQGVAGDDYKLARYRFGFGDGAVTTPASVIIRQENTILSLKPIHFA
jgi:hypothetical protein